MAVKVAKNRDSRGLLDWELHWELHKVNFRVQDRAWVCPTSIEISAAQWRPGISDDNSVWVEHRNKLDDVTWKNFVIFLIISCELSQNLAHNEASVSLTRVKTRLDVNYLLRLIFKSSCVPPLRNRDLENIQASNRLSDDFLPVQQIRSSYFEVLTFSWLLSFFLL